MIAEESLPGFAPHRDTTDARTHWSGFLICCHHADARRQEGVASFGGIAPARSGVETLGVIMWDGRFETLLRAELPFLSMEEELAEDLPLRDFGLDSLGMVQLLNVLEGEYRLRFGAEFLRVETFQTPGSLWKAISGMRTGSS
ncbi:acyl carrier protein [Streptomyces sp. NPDC048483]|uniref:acyl carrier protein n=1 Tax=Streptomyces sp. NPDC048483 TaxID=3154927 RepID=UPI0034390159